MTDNSFTQFVPGFDFLQSLAKNAGSALPGIGQWVAPTLNPEELGKRIDELRTVQFWLEQNARMLGATIQAMEVQRMTLSTLKSMNVPLADLQNALKIPAPESAPAANAWTSMSADMMAAAAKMMPMAMSMPTAAAAEPKAKAPEPVPEPVVAPKAKAAAEPAADTAATSATPVTPAVDPLQWWGALSQQFTQLATAAMKDSAADAAKNLAGAMVKQSFDAAGETLLKAASVPNAVAESMAGNIAKTLTPKAAPATGAKPKPASAAASQPAQPASPAAARKRKP
jgi:hypothetical protein